VEIGVEKNKRLMPITIFPLEKLNFILWATQNIKHDEDFFVNRGIFQNTKNDKEKKFFAVLKK